MVEKQPDKVFRVSSNSPTKELGAAIAQTIYADQAVSLRAIGHGAIGQAAKGVAVAEQLAARQGVRMKTNFHFETAGMPDGKEVSLIIMRIVAD